MTTVTGTRELGKLPVRRDVRTLRIARYVDRAKLPRRPHLSTSTTHVPEWPMYANDRLGDCTIARGRAHDRGVDRRGRAARRGLRARGDRCVRAGEESSTRRPGRRGRSSSTCLKYWRKTGIGAPPDRRVRAGPGARPRARAHAPRTSSAASTSGVELPLTAQDQDGLGLDGLARPGRRDPGRGAATPSTSSATTRHGRHGRHLGRGQGDDVGVLGPLLRRGVLHPVARLPRTPARRRTASSSRR